MEQRPPLEDALIALLRHVRLVVGLPLTAAAVAAGIVLLIPNRYTATTTFFPETRAATGASQLASLAAAAGVAVNLSEPSYSPEFFADLLKSRPIVYAVLQQRFPTFAGASAHSDSLELLEILRVNGKTESERFENGARVLMSTVSVDVDRQTGVVALSVTLKTPELASQVANALLDGLLDFNLHSRQTQAHARRVFTQSRVDDAAANLASAEDSLRRFLERNRDFRNSPTLNFQEQRLQRQVELQQELYVSLRHQLETDRINEVNDLPALTTIARAIPPSHKTSPRRTRTVLWALLLTAGATMAGIAFYERERENLRVAAERALSHVRPQLPRALARRVTARDPGES